MYQKSGDDHEALLLEEEHVFIEQYETLDKHFKTHQLLGTRMLNAQFPGS